MPFPPGSGAIAVVLEHLGDGGAALRHDARVSIPIVRQLADLTVADTMGIATRQQGGASGRTHRGRMKPVVGDSLMGNLAQRRCVDFATVSVGLGRPDIIDEHDEDIGRILR